MRRRKGVGAKGVALWQWNEPWPAISWAVVDYDGRPKEGAEGLRAWYHPLLLSLEWRWPIREGPEQEVPLWAINDLAVGFEGCEARVVQGGRCLLRVPVEVEPQSARVIGKFSLREVELKEAPVRVELWQGERLLAENSYSLQLPGPERGPLLGMLYRSVAEWLMRW
jgi:beta-mannosidase